MDGLSFEVWVEGAFAEYFTKFEELEECVYTMYKQRTVDDARDFLKNIDPYRNLPGEEIDD